MIVSAGDDGLVIHTYAWFSVKMATVKPQPHGYEPEVELHLLHWLDQGDDTMLAEERWHQALHPNRLQMKTELGIEDVVAGHMPIRQTTPSAAWHDQVVWVFPCEGGLVR